MQGVPPGQDGEPGSLRTVYQHHAAGTFRRGPVVFDQVSRKPPSYVLVICRARCHDDTAYARLAEFLPEQLPDAEHHLFFCTSNTIPRRTLAANPSQKAGVFPVLLCLSASPTGRSPISKKPPVGPKGPECSLMQGSGFYGDAGRPRQHRPHSFGCASTRFGLQLCRRAWTSWSWKKQTASRDLCLRPWALAGTQGATAAAPFLSRKHCFGFAGQGLACVAMISQSILRFTAYGQRVAGDEVHL